jgi:hypothetical protein
MDPQAEGSQAPEHHPVAGRAVDPRVEDALSRLDELDGMPLAEQVAVFDDIHQRLEGVLADPGSRG